MTPEQKMQKVVEAAGECWHEGFDHSPHICKKCGEEQLNYLDHIEDLNPSPTDLNELFRLAEKLGFEEIIIEKDNTGCGWYAQVVQHTKQKSCLGIICSTTAEALLNALYEAVK